MEVLSCWFQPRQLPGGMNWGTRALARQFHRKHLLCPSNSLLDPQLARIFSAVWVHHKKGTATQTVRSTNSHLLLHLKWSSMGQKRFSAMQEGPFIQSLTPHTTIQLHCEAWEEEEPAQNTAQSYASEWPTRAHRELPSSSGLLSIFTGKGKAHMENSIFIHVKATSDPTYVSRTKR